MIAAERSRQLSSNCFNGDEDTLKIDDSVNFASDSVQKKSQVEANSSADDCVPLVIAWLEQGDVLRGTVDAVVVPHWKSSV